MDPRTETGAGAPAGTALLVEGGGLRGAFSAGALAQLSEAARAWLHARRAGQRDHVRPRP
ncbi:MAG: hypothetical protein IT372_06290 [Polyangiaceae bacterium]|nr:hypothetical protein [Polyangiaceae bacterium]